MIALYLRRISANVPRQDENESFEEPPLTSYEANDDSSYR
jgi:hypothetical protein